MRHATRRDSVAAFRDAEAIADIIDLRAIAAADSAAVFELLAMHSG